MTSRNNIVNIGLSILLTANCKPQKLTSVGKRIDKSHVKSRRYKPGILLTSSPYCAPPIL